MNKWFSDTFLPSLFERAGTNKSIWLSRKQTAICVDNMEKHTIRQTQFQGDYTSHNYYTCEWQGRKITLQYSKLNGCGTIEFSMNKEESEAANKKHAEEKAKIEAERIAKIKQNPERLEKRINKAKKELDNWAEELKELYQELENPIEGISKEETLQDIELTKEQFNLAKIELEKWTN